MKLEYLTKLIASSNLYSRRAAEQLIRDGKVKVNSKPAVLGQQATTGDKIEINGKTINLKIEKRLIAFHKPANYITSHSDEKGRPTIFDILPKELANFHYIGRLDFNSKGLLLLTNDAKLKEKLERGNQIRGYKIKIEGKITKPTLTSLEKGITIDGFNYKGLKAEILDQNDKFSSLNVYLTEGKNREIRRIFEYLGHQVKELTRFSYGPYQLKDLEKAGVREEKFPKI